jgi:hypothetical protein
MPDRSSSATTSPAFTIVPSGTMLEIFIWYWLACWAFWGTLIWTNLRARSSPEVVTTVLNSPRLTRATTEVSAALGPRARSHAPGTPTSNTPIARMSLLGRGRRMGSLSSELGFDPVGSAL